MTNVDGAEQDARTLAIVRRRSSPKFFLTDGVGHLLACSPELDGSFLERSRRKLHEILAREESLREPEFELADRDTLLRFVPLTHEDASYYAVFVEPVKRDGVAAAIKRFGVSKREAEVLEALMAGRSTPLIARQLFISEATVGEHVKNLFKKTKTNRRSELIARILRDTAHEMSGPPSPT